jgi:Peptidase A4 family
MRKTPRAGATAACVLAAALTASAFAIAPAPSAPPVVSARARAYPLPAKVQPGGPLAARGNARAAALGFSDAATTTVVSGNWGGYAVGRRGVRFRYVRATFFVPYLDCASSPFSFSGHWVGLDGMGSPTVEQDGILAACQGNRPVYLAWYEMFPHPPVYAKMTVRPGNSIVASVYYSARNRKYTLTLTDTTTGAQFTTAKKCPGGATCRRLSAEAISEAPTSGTAILPLSNFRAMSFSDIAVTDQRGRHGGLRARWWDTLGVVTEGAHGRVLDRPTSIAQGRAFSDYWMAPR